MIVFLNMKYCHIIFVSQYVYDLPRKEMVTAVVTQAEKMSQMRRLELIFSLSARKQTNICQCHVTESYQTVTHEHFGQWSLAFVALGQKPMTTNSNCGQDNTKELLSSFRFISFPLYPLLKKTSEFDMKITLMSERHSGFVFQVLIHQQNVLL